MRYKSLEDAAAGSDRLLSIPRPTLGDLYAEKIIPARALVTLTAAEVVDRVLFPAKKPTLLHDEWIANLTSSGIAADFEAQNLWLEHHVSETRGWRLVSSITGAGVFPWGVTFLAADYHDYSAQPDVDFMLRLGGLQMALASRHEGEMIPPSPWEVARVRALEARLGNVESSLSYEEALSWRWPKDVKMGAVLARVVDSREYGLRTGTLTMSPLLADEFIEYYEDKFRAAVRGIDQEDREVAMEWDRAHTRDHVSGYRFVELEAPTADAEALLAMKWDATKREKRARRDGARASAEIGVAFFRGKIKAGKYRLPGTGIFASVRAPHRGIRVPPVRFFREKKIDLDPDDDVPVSGR